jgi:thymidylate synthase (FAD)
MGSDAAICEAARVSTVGSSHNEGHDPDKDRGLINFLMKNRHGTPFEHTSLKFYVSAPIFVFREFHRHRIGFSYNEESGRYKKLEPVFYLPRDDRPLQQIGKTGHYEYIPGTPDQLAKVEASIRTNSIEAYERYQNMLDAGIAKEVARMVLPVNIFSSMYVTCNTRSLMAFLSLRTKSDNAHFKSFPMQEIEMVARMLEDHFIELFPITSASFDLNGRIVP